jgi:hypothetical protein
LLLTTRRLDYSPPWLDHTVVTKLLLEALPIGDIRRLIRGRPGVEVLPESFAWQVAEKAEGNPLFAEEIASFLSEQGIVRTSTGKLDFDATVVATALPTTVQSLLAARVDRLAPNDRALLQAASVIGRQFEPQLLAVVVGSANIDARLTAIRALDLVHQKSKSGNYSFKHALVRDALYQSLLSEARTALHLKIAEEIERRSGNRLTEVAEVLAHHYSQTDHAEKAFAYLSMAGSKSLGVYSLDEASDHLTAALALIDKNPASVSNSQLADFLLPYALLLNMRVQVHVMIEVLGRYLSRVDCIGDDPRAVVIRHHYVFALMWNKRYRDAAAVQRETSLMADRLGDSRSKAYALAGEIIVSTIFAPKPLKEFEILKTTAIRAASGTADAYIQNWTWWVIGWDLMHRGSMNDARDSARELMQVGRSLSDPRSTGFGLNLLSWVALISDSYGEALEYSDQSISVAVTVWDRVAAACAKICALTFLRRIEEAAKLSEEQRRRITVDGDFYSLTPIEPMEGLCKVLHGNIAGGIRILEETIVRRENEGYRANADWCRGILTEVYLEILAGNERPQFAVFLKNLPIILKVMLTAPSRIRSWERHTASNSQFDPNGFFMGRSSMVLGLLYRKQRKQSLAVQHLVEAKRILSQFGNSATLARVEAALAEFGQQA